MFKNFEKEVYESIIDQEDQDRLYNPAQLQDQEENVHKAITELYEKIGILKGDQCLAGLITFYGEGRE